MFFGKTKHFTRVNTAYQQLINAWGYFGKFLFVI
ncbi:MAG: hypothetical protein UR94_C0011G0026 [Parcubacteria group bacterium GW2011_GWA2_36_10]|nr:MAG: hypothetical protein UR94_C0011G0026 [Parcubacteria group bacterium GW2011_GWA2_36_10]